MPFGAYGVDFSGKRRTGPAYFREVSTRKRPPVNLAFDLAPLAGSGLYLSALRTIPHFLHDPSLTRSRCREGSGSPPESWRRRGLEHGIHFRRRPLRSDQADCDRRSGPGDGNAGIAQLIIGVAPRLRDDDNAPRAAGETGPAAAGEHAAHPYKANRSVRMQR